MPRRHLTAGAVGCAALLLAPTAPLSAVGATPRPPSTSTVRIDRADDAGFPDVTIAGHVDSRVNACVPSRTVVLRNKDTREALGRDTTDVEGDWSVTFVAFELGDSSGDLLATVKRRTVGRHRCGPDSDTANIADLVGP